MSECHSLLKTVRLKRCTLNNVSLQRDVTVLARRAVSAFRPPTRPAAGPPAHRQRYIRRQTTDASEQNNTGLLGGAVITLAVMQ